MYAGGRLERRCGQRGRRRYAARRAVVGQQKRRRKRGNRRRRGWWRWRRRIGYYTKSRQHAEPGQDWERYDHQVTKARL
jgi:hypothetical protein